MNDIMEKKDDLKPKYDSGIEDSIRNMKIKEHMQYKHSIKTTWIDVNLK